MLSMQNTDSKYIRRRTRFQNDFFFSPNIGRPSYISNINCRCFTRSRLHVKYTNVFRQQRCFKTFGNSTYFFAKTNSRVANLRFLSHKQVGSRKNRLRSIVVCVTRMQRPDMNRECGLVWSRQRIIFVCYFPIFGCRFENIKDRLSYLSFFLDWTFIHIALERERESEKGRKGERGGEKERERERENFSERKTL